MQVIAVFVVAAACLVTTAVATGHVFAIDDSMLLLLRKTADTREPVGPHWLLNAFENYTSLGSSAVTGLVLAIGIFWAIAEREYRSGVYMAVVYAGAQLLSNVTKILIGRPRPEVVPHLVYAGGYSFPSGHSTLSAATYLAIGLLVAGRECSVSKRMLILSVAAAISAVVGLSRIYLGVHYPTDVLDGWLLGAGWALVVLVFFRKIQRGRFGGHVKGRNEEG
ncbi:phosphatase PAP2 family protein [Rhizobium sp. BK376]|uniref:phosphatase PAP2 family protein n=1 Tax=Rhizobium sp. BK376 TaxID=2512149 RepID=UPI001404961C|nr:phosphatase PAP2 family protein [Rhizobium sp. BK376]